MTRAHRKVRVFAAQVYSVEEICGVYNVTRNTVTNWIHSGLRKSDERRPYVFRGAELQRFHKARETKDRKNLKHGEFNCLACSSAVFPDTESLRISTTSKGRAMALGVCPDCRANVSKLLGVTECDIVQNCIATNTSLAWTDELTGNIPACIGNKATVHASDWYNANDRVLHEWQSYAGRYDLKTVQAHLYSIRDFESFLGGKPFDKVSPKDAGAYRDHLVKLGQLQKPEGGLSSSTIRHRVAHLRAFFQWLCHQDGYRRLSGNIPAYFELPRASRAKTLPRDDRDFLTIEEAESMVRKMPGKTRVERRDRAMVAFAYVSGLRASALASLRLKHVDIEKKEVVQDAREMEAKNGKSFRVYWFARTDVFQDIFLAWLEELLEWGFEPRDAVFPDASNLTERSPELARVEPMRTARALQAAFQRATALIDRNCSPHSARHTLKALGDSLCSSMERRKAWSLNLGHSTERITEAHYAKMSDQHRRGIMEGLGADDLVTEEEATMIIDYYENRFTRGTEEHRIARRLAKRREQSRDGEDVID
ncbi:tyrosine-type recombinase/integrase [Sulfitobacter aestuarii]|uniref:Tyrosine-type recombinase/integrase n=1 Tax=Sulfitobacter aestuarii TaxID=2161676 RepID=A0ABW5TYX5_9RHOB